MKSKNLAKLYDLPLIDWPKIEARLEQGITQGPGTGGPDRHTSWLATINGDGSPHVTGVGALWTNGAFWIATGEQSVKGKNLARDARCTLSLATHDFDLAVEAEAEKVLEPETVAAMAELWSAQGWPAHVDETGVALTAAYSAPSAGPAPWAVYRIIPRRATAISTIEPGGATRWTFSTPGTT